MSRRKDQGEETPMLDLVASLAGGDHDEEAAVESASESDQADADDSDVEASGDDPMAGLLADAGIAPDVADAAAASFVEDGEEEDHPSDPEVETAADTETATPAPTVAEIPVEVVDTAKQDVIQAPKPKSSPPQAKQVSRPSSAPAKGSASERILLRQDVLDIATELEAGRIGKRTAVRRMRDVCEDDAAALDLDDIEVDFDATPEDRSGLSFLAGLGAPKPQARDVDPVEIALLAAMKLRDRVSALSIVGDTPTAEDRAAYKSALSKLREALNAHLPD